MHPERSFAVRLMRAGANGYVPKMIVPEELVKAVRAVGTGRRYITPLVAELLASECAADEEDRCTTDSRSASCRSLPALPAASRLLSWRTSWA